TYELRRERLRAQSRSRHLYRPHSQGRETSRHAGCAADPVRAGHQPADGEGDRPGDSVDAALTRRRGDRMKRRDFITLLGGAAATWPLAARAQQAKLPTIGFLGASTPLNWNPWTAAFVQRLRELGWIEGSTVAIEYRWAEGRNERYSEIATE